MFIYENSTNESTSTDNSSIPDNQTLEYSDTIVPDYWQNIQTGNIYRFCSPVLIVVGTIGNLLAVLTLQSRLFQSSSTSFILSALALTDIFVLDTGLLRWWLMYLENFNVRNVSRFSCKIHNLCTYYSHQLASWTLILLTVERVISVTLPFKYKILCSRKRIVIVWTVIATVLFLINCHFFFSFDIVKQIDITTQVVSYKCWMASDFWEWFFNFPWSWIDACLGDFFPFAVVLFGNVIILAKLKTQNQIHGKEKAVGKTSSTTAMLISVSVIFLIFNVPMDINVLGYSYGLFPDNNEEQDAVSNLFFAIVNMLYYTNNAIEFVLYFISGSKFRKAFFEMIGCSKIKIHPTTSVPNTSTE